MVGESSMVPILPQPAPDVNQFLHKVVLESSRVYPLTTTKITGTTQKWHQVVDFRDLKMTKIAETRISRGNLRAWIFNLS